MKKYDAGTKNNGRNVDTRVEKRNIIKKHTK